jgi:hypothetical protein
MVRSEYTHFGRDVERYFQVPEARARPVTVERHGARHSRRFTRRFTSQAKCKWEALFSEDIEAA